MTAVPANDTGPRLWPFRLLAGLVALAMALTGGHNLVTGWADPLDGGIHRLQELDWGIAEGLLLAVSLAWQLRRPQRHLDAMRVAVAAVVAQLLVAVATFSPDPFGIALLVLIGGALLAHPRRREVLRPALHVSRGAAAVGGPTALALLGFAAVQVGHHYAAAPHDLLEAKTGWVGAAIATTALALVVLVATFTGGRFSTTLGASGLLILGAASLLHPQLPSSFATAGGAAAIAAAVSLVATSSRTSPLPQNVA
jgi:hypothetical protein